ncbi:MAG: CHAD domain-containing protein [Solirubrobacteraceae bacterium]
MSLGELIATDRPLADAGRALHGWFTIRVGTPAQTRRTYLDTFDGRFYRQGLTLSAAGEQRTLERRDGAPVPGGLYSQDVAGVRALLPIAEVSLTEQSLDVLDEREKTVCRIVLETPVGLRVRARLHGLRGYEGELRRVHQLLGAGHGFEQARLALVDEAVLAAGGDPAGSSTKVQAAFAADTRADVAVTEVLLGLLAIIDANLPGTLAATDSEFLRSYRVAIRRTRAVMKGVAGVFPPERLPALRDEFRRLQEATGQTRDLEVYVAQFPQLEQMVPPVLRADLTPLEEVLRAWRASSRDHMERELTGEHARRLHADWEGLLAELPQLPERGRPDAARPIGRVAGERIARVHRRMVRAGRVITPRSEPQAYHDLRKRGKELRYLLELFAAPLYPADVVAPMIAALKGLQDLLGRHQDRWVQVRTLKRLSDRVLAHAGDGGALLAMGALAERLEADAQLARDGFADGFAAFASAAQCKLVRTTFR